MVEVIVDQLQKRSAHMQAEKADDFEQGKTTAGLLTVSISVHKHQNPISRNF